MTEVVNLPPCSEDTPLKAKPFNAAWLMEQHFAPVQYVVPGVIPEGLTMLVAAPKIGKSWMSLGLGCAVSTGTAAFGAIPTGKARPVLYLALEDGQRRLQDRLRSLNPDEISDKLHFIVDLNGDDPRKVLTAFFTKNKSQAPVAIIDTLGRIQDAAAGNETQYAADYKFLASLKATADAVPGASLIVVHHTRKQLGSDFLDAVSGTQGIAGAADTIIVIRRERGDQTATLSVTSRDAAEGEYQLEFHDDGRWALAGESLEDAARAVQAARATAGVGDQMARVIEVVDRHPQGIRTKDVKTLLPDVENVDTLLSRAYSSNRLARLSRGLYAPVRSVRSDRNEADILLFPSRDDD
ncbi:Regulatory protein RepA [Pseudoclavibacter triregionum]|nr:Regulatory protein RepA [Pseudoclavibacter triregionum]